MPPQLTVRATVEGDGVGWNRFVEGHADGTVSHLFEWRDVIERAYGKPAQYLIASAASEIVGVFPCVRMSGILGARRVVSMPYLDEGGVLADSAEVEEAIWRRARETLAGRHASIEVRSPLLHQESDADEPTRRYRLVLDLPPTGEELWSAIGGKVRNQIRKSRKLELTTARVGTEELPAFYEVFARNMRDLGSPVHARGFLAEVLEQFGDRARLYLTTDGNGRVVAGAIALRFQRTSTVPWASSLRAARSSCPNHSLYWQVLEEAIGEGARRFDFGRSTVDTGTFNFKQQWGARAIPLHWRRYSREGARLEEAVVGSRHRSKLVAVWSRLPVPLANVIGPRIRRHLPA